MNRRTLALVSLPAVLAAAAYGSFGRHHRSNHASAVENAAPAPRAGMVPRIRYRLELDEQAGLVGQKPIAITTRGTWTTIPHGDRLEVRYAAARLDGPAGAVPAAEAVAAPIELAQHGGVLDGIGFPDEMPALSRTFLTSLATTFQYSAKDGAGWRVGEEDLTGRYDAIYLRDGDAVRRSRPAYTALRREAGLQPVAGDAVTSTEGSRFEVDGEGVVHATIALDLRIPMGDGVPSVTLHLRGSLDREAIDWVPAPRGRLLAMLPIQPHVDVGDREQIAARAAVDGERVEAVLARALAIAAQDRGDQGVRHQRAALLHQLAMEVKVDPSAAGPIADALAAHAADESTAMLLAGALSSTEVAAGTDALAHLAGQELPAVGHQAVINALSLSEPATANSLAALTHSLDGAGGDEAAMGAGIHVRALRSSDPELAGAATRTLLDRYAAATSDAQRVVYLQALGNAGDPAALPVLRQAIASHSQALAEAAVFALRFLPDGEADDVLAAALADELLAFAAVRAAAFRDRSIWAGRLAEARARFPRNDSVQNAVNQILAGWA